VHKRGTLFFFQWIIIIYRRIRKFKRGTLFWKSQGYLASQSRETRNLSSLDQEELLDHMNDPPARKRFMRPCSKINSENSIIASEKRAIPNLSQGKRVTLKSLTMHQVKSHQQKRPANSSPIKTDIRTINPHKSPSWDIINISKRASHNILPHTHLNLLHNLISAEYCTFKPLKWHFQSIVKDIIVNSHPMPTAASTFSSSLMDSTQTLAAATQTLDKSAVNQGYLPQQSHTRILSPYKTYS
jgi:hypothetical protein